MSYLLGGGRPEGGGPGKSHGFMPYARGAGILYISFLGKDKETEKEYPGAGSLGISSGAGSPGGGEAAHGVPDSRG